MTAFISCYICVKQLDLAVQPGYNYNKTQLTFTYSKSTIETLEKGVKYAYS